MGRVILFLLIIAAAVLVWKAFGPASWKKGGANQPQPREIKGPDDDEDFLWELEKKQFKQRRAKEEAEKKRIERERLEQQRLERQRLEQQRQQNNESHDPKPDAPNNPSDNNL